MFVIALKIRFPHTEFSNTDPQGPPRLQRFQGFFPSASSVSCDDLLDHLQFSTIKHYDLQQAENVGK
ncbi:hypothetical protein XELAEV_18046994mg [Xenopus laevis]|uniref:Uncharacterized protein n=1 Tax=Xenopus laevis TaxID=8355 RepID=A0A974BU93_XENLA|nr:hypothetical protein XELAEV_18046994mg [Xenopus laevis]